MIEKEKIGLVLSGGGSKGVAHGGVMQFLNELKIEPQIIAGCSAGSLVGSLYAIGKTPEEILEFFRSVYFFNWIHFAFNKPGLISSKIFSNYLKPIFEDRTIGDLDKELKIVATELVSGKLKVFDKKTNLIDAIIASCSIPGITTPYIVGNEMYCDGSVLNNFPSDLIKNDCDKIIGVFVSPPQDVTIDDLNTIKSVVSRSYDLLSYRSEKYKFEYCDWFITSKELSQFRMFERKSEVLNDIFSIGYKAAKASYPKNFKNKI